MNLEARREAVGSLSSLLRRDDAYLSEHHATKLAERLVAHAMLVRGYLADVEEGARLVLKQARTHEFESVEWWGEHVNHLRRELSDAEACWERAKAGRVPEYDPDAAGEREDDRRISTELADQAAANAMPGVS